MFRESLSTEAFCDVRVCVVVLLTVLFATANVSAGDGEVRTIAGNGQHPSGPDRVALQTAVGGPFGVALGPRGGLVVCETAGHVVRRIDLTTGVIETIAGTGGRGYSGDGGLATKARLDEPYEVRFDKVGNLFFVEMQNHVVRRVDAKTGIITTVAGTGESGFRGDGGPAVKAKMNRPHSIALDDVGGLYICDIGNHRVRRVELATGIITTFAGTGERKLTPDGSAIQGTPLNGPRALDYQNGSLYLALREGNAIYRMDLKNRKLQHLAGTGKKGYAGDGGPARLALLSGPKGVSVAENGDIYFADTESHTIRVVRKARGIIETVAGTGRKGDGPDGDPLRCRMNRPHGVFVDAQGRVFIGDSSNNRVRVLVPRP
jgi:streptogramin lyase